MAVCIHSAAITGIEATIISVETRITSGVQYFIVGLPDESVKESLFRVESAICSADLNMPRQKIVISMAPAGIRKQGALFDLPIALSILAESNQVEAEKLEGFISVGELSLNGRLRPVKGVLSMAIQAKKAGFTSMIVPEENTAEAAIVGGLKVYGFDELKTIYQFLKGKNGKSPASHRTRDLFKADNNIYPVDFTDIQGQAYAKRALEIAAAGGHNLIMIGPPGSGKTMLARRFPTILPPLNLHEALETTRIYSISGQLETEGLIPVRPFRSPHHTASDIAMVGGGFPPQPGEISLAHNGVLFLDELLEFKRKVLEVLRQPMKERQITISRASYIAAFPSAFLFIAAMNPCPCGFYGQAQRKCSCTKNSVRQYRSRTSGPLLDRIDLHIKVDPVNFAYLANGKRGESSETIRARVIDARNIQQRRQPDLSKSFCNAQLNPDSVRKFCRLLPTEQEVLMQAMEKHKLSARSYDRILKVSRTIADLGGAEQIAMTHLSEAIGYRCLDQDY